MAVDRIIYRVMKIENRYVDKIKQEFCLNLMFRFLQISAYEIG